MVLKESIKTNKSITRVYYDYQHIAHGLPHFLRTAHGGLGGVERGRVETTSTHDRVGEAPKRGKGQGTTEDCDDFSKSLEQEDQGDAHQDQGVGGEGRCGA